jgi:iron complex outermembrane recepter protein
MTKIRARERRGGVGLVSLWLALGVSSVALASDPSEPLVDQSLEDLLEIEITSISKRPQKVGDVAAAVFVITQDDIRRSGHSSIPELLRLVPGMAVGRSTPKSWNVGIRGDESAFSRMLLVLLDGRPVYATSFNGTFWEEVNLPLEDVERIEIIRGPGASVWGANAVHGVINIIRKRPEQARSFLSTSIGNEDRTVTSAGFGGALDGLDFRASGHYFNRDAFRARDGSVAQHDDQRGGAFALRADLELSERDTLVLQGDWYGHERGAQVRRDLDPTGTNVLRSFETTSWSGGNALLRFERTYSETAAAEVQLYVDRAYRDVSVGRDLRRHYDLELRHRFAWGRHLLNWGAGVRRMHERPNGTLNFILTPASQEEATYSFFLQDELDLVPDSVRMTLGTKVEWNTFTGWEIQPTARMLWHVSERQQLWAAVSRAVRTPARFDRGEYEINPVYVFNTPVRVSGSADFDSEVILNADVGYRLRPLPDLLIDVSGFTARTQNFTVFVPADPPLFLGQRLSNSGERSSIGAEASIRWQPQANWRLAFGWSHIHIRHTGGPYATGGTRSAPPHQFSLISQFDLPANLELDLAVYYHGRYGKRYSPVQGEEFNAYTRHDVRLGWHPTPQLELSLIGQNLLDRLHREGIDFFEGDPLVTGLPQSSVQRSVSLRATWHF